MTDAAGSIQTDELHGDDDVTDAFLSNLTGEPPKRRSTETAEEARAAPEGTEGDDAADDKPAEDAGETAETETEGAGEDDPEFEIKVGDDIKKAKLSALKRLFGQEAALTQKSQKASELLSRAETSNRVVDEHMTRLRAKAEEAYKPYAELDMPLLATKLSTEDYLQLKADAAASKANLDYFQQEASTLLQARQQDAQRAHTQAIQAARAELEDPERGIPGFGPELYGKLDSFAKSQGLPQFQSIVQPAAIRVMHMAMQWAEAQKNAKSAEAKVSKVVHKPSKVARPGTKDTAPQGTTALRSAMADLRKSGSQDATAAAFLASFSQ